MTRRTLPITAAVNVYNSERTIVRALESIAAQSCLPAEILVIDDGGTDASAEIARRAGARVISQPNQGVGGGRNTAARAASQPWIAYLDGDDAWYPHKLERQWQAHELRPDVAVITTEFDRVWSDRRERRPMLREHAAYRRTIRTPLGPGIVAIERSNAARRLVEGNFILPSALMVARVRIVNDGVFALGVAQLAQGPLVWETEDLEWFLRLLVASDLVVVEEPLTEYHLHGSNLSSNQARMRYGDVFLCRRVLARPADYPPIPAAELEHIRSWKQREAAWEFVRRGQTSFARHVMREALAERRSLRNAVGLGLVLLLDNRLGRRVLEATRIVWKRVLKREVSLTAEP